MLKLFIHPYRIKTVCSVVRWIYYSNVVKIQILRTLLRNKPINNFYYINRPNGSENESKANICMFRRLFEDHAELLHLFEKFRELRTKEEQANSLELAEHASTVMNTLDEGIKGLDNLDAFFEYLHQVGASHRRIPGFKVEYFWVRNPHFSIDSANLILAARF